MLKIYVFPVEILSKEISEGPIFNANDRHSYVIARSLGNPRRKKKN